MIIRSTKEQTTYIIYKIFEKQGILSVRTRYLEWVRGVYYDNPYMFEVNSRNIKRMFDLQGINYLCFNNKVLTISFILRVKKYFIYLFWKTVFYLFNDLYYLPNILYILS